MPNRTKLLAAAGVLMGAFAIILGLLGQQGLALAALGAAVCVILLMSFLSNRLLAARTAQLRERMQADRRSVIAEIRLNRSSISRATLGAAANASPPIGNTAGQIATLGGVGPVYEFAERALKAPGGLETFALRTQSTAMRDVFARAATGMQYDLEDVLRTLRSLRAGRLPGATAAIRSWKPKILMILARLLANQRLKHTDIDDAELIFFAATQVFGEKILSKTDAYVYSEVLTSLNRYRDAHHLLKRTRVASREPVHAALVVANQVADRIHPDWHEWGSLVSDIFAAEGLAPITVEHHANQAPLDCLSTLVAPRTVTGPLVTVVVPTFNGSDLIATTLRCLIEQTWQNLEIIVVDDGSEAHHRERLAEICRDLPDVTLLQQASNLGAYPARNLALAHAKGEFITVHDDDDWSHAQKIEIQAQDLLNNPTRVANMTRHARSTDGLITTRINNNPSFSQPNFSSLMFRRALTEKIGIWDEVNRGADAEFRDRLVAASGLPVEVLLAAPMSFTRTHAASLTAGEMNRGYVDPSRLLYAAAYEQAHRQIEAGGGPWHAPDFVKPLNMQPGMRGQDLGRFDVIYATDFRFLGGTSQLTLNEIEAAAAAGLRVGVIHMISPLNGGATELAARTLEVMRLTGVEVLSLNDQAAAALLVIRHPSVLQFAEGLTSKLRISRMVVIVNNPPVLTGGRGYAFDFATVTKNAKALFGVNPEIVAESGVTQRDCRALTRNGELSPGLWPGFVDLTRFTPREHDFESVPVLGRHSRDAELKWPSDITVLKQVYGPDLGYHVQILGGMASAGQDAHEAVAQQGEIFEFGSLEPPAFLAALDFWAYYHSDQLTESFGMATVEAMASGLVVILPPYMEVNFGDGAVYAEPGQVAQVVREYWGDPTRYRAQAARARSVAEERFSKQAFLKRLSNEISKS